MIFDENGGEMFSRDVEKYVQKNGGEYIDAVLEMCTQYTIEPQLAAKFISQPIIEKIHAEGQKINLLPNNVKLPI
jgi:hypothetical protein